MWEKGGDPKAQELRSLLEKLPKTDQHGVPTKAAPFTSYRDTALPLFKQFGRKLEDLKSNLRVSSNLADGRQMTLLTGSYNLPRRRTVLEHFAPLAMYRDAEPLNDPALNEKVRPFRDRTSSYSSPPMSSPRSRTSRMPSSSSITICPGTRCA